MRRHLQTSALFLAVLGLFAACARPPGLATFSSERRGFSIAYPTGWEIVRLTEDARVWFLPPGAARTPRSSAEFLFVLTEEQAGPLGDDEARQRGLSLLPIHGVSGFRRFKEEQEAVWHRFEVTGSAQGADWASVGLLVSGKKTLQYVVCAKPLDRWRDGQKQCDEILKTFRAGPLS